MVNLNKNILSKIVYGLVENTIIVSYKHNITFARIHMIFKVSEVLSNKSDLLYHHLKLGIMSGKHNYQLQMKEK